MSSRGSHTRNQNMFTLPNSSRSVYTHRTTDNKLWFITVFPISWSQGFPNRNFNQIPDWKHYFCVHQCSQHHLGEQLSVMGWSNIVATTLYTYEMGELKMDTSKLFKLPKNVSHLRTRANLRDPLKWMHVACPLECQQRLEYIKLQTNYWDFSISSSTVRFDCSRALRSFTLTFPCSHSVVPSSTKRLAFSLSACLNTLWTKRFVRIVLPETTNQRVAQVTSPKTLWATVIDYKPC